MILPDKVARIENNAFMNCNSLTSISFGSGISYISGSTSANDGPFYHCNSLNKIIIRDLSAWCNAILGGYYLNGKQIYSAEDTQIKKLIIPDDVTCIKERTFSGCEVETVIIPNSV